jgi:hypothetical protein
MIDNKLIKNKPHIFFNDIDICMISNHYYFIHVIISVKEKVKNKINLLFIDFIVIFTRFDLKFKIFLKKINKKKT